MKNKLFMGVLVGILALVMSVPAVAVDTLPAKGQIQISDPSTMELGVIGFRYFSWWHEQSF